MGEIIMEKEAAPRFVYQLASVYEQVRENGDDMRTEKLIELYDKYKKQELTICFAGHFSAGKSSMINALLGQDILPNSPIPTSANIVKITSGKGSVRVYFKHSDPEEYKEPFNLEVLKQYSMDKDNIQKIEISTSEQLLPSNSAFIDTPGIDAADDADRLMTEGSLHLMDALFYVMDYNHVQSEVNLQFMLDVQQKNIPFYIIINQIDKHKESELTFASFKESIKQTFDLWEIKPEKIFYTSLYEPESKHNQFTELQKAIQELLTSRKQALLDRKHHIDDIITQHVDFLQEQYEEALENDYVTSEQQEKLAKKSIIVDALSALEQREADFKADFYSILQETVKNAYLMPATLRDKATSFLESQQSDFKVGFIGAKKKTEEERKKRLTEFVSDLQQNVEAGLQWKLRDKWLQLIKAYKVDDGQVQHDLHHFTIAVKEEDLIRTMKQGATLNGDVILHYTNDVAHEIKKRAKQLAHTLWNQIEQAFQAEVVPERSRLKQQLTEINYIQEKLNHYYALVDELEQKQTMVRQARYHESATVKMTIVEIEEHVSKQKKRIKFASEPALFKRENIPDKLLTKSSQTTTELTEKNQPVDRAIKAIEQTIDTVKNLPGFQSLIEDLSRKQQRLQHRTYTIALFGAFSAGKSSFANALMGEAVLPVSPNPTTATVNRIHPVTDKNQHGTLLVQLKTKQELVKEITSMTKKFSPVANELEELITWITREQLHHHPDLENTYQSFLQALLSGFDSIKDDLGEEIILSIEAFPSYVADETKACFVDTIDLFYDCELTRQGISLVDTPGADSVHARHTNVAFNYIKHADAILYVTYYNHALNRTDKDFLMQLGRVKDAFELDKMFFVVNAADLAKDKAELSLVSTYVKEQLTQLGIRFPRLYPVSSRKALTEKQMNHRPDELMSKFEDDFYPFIHHGLTKLAVAAAYRDVERIEQQLQQFIASQKLDQQEKEAFKNAIEQKRQQIEQIIDRMKGTIEINQVKQKVEKQIYYVLERFSIRFHDIFKETFNPATITESGKEGRQQVWICLQNLVDYCQTELLRELQAVSLRLEAFMNDKMLEVYRSVEKQSQKIDHSFLLAEIDRKKIASPDFIEPLKNVNLQAFAQIVQSYKHTKAFFAKNEKEQMKETIFELLKPVTKQSMDEKEQMMAAFYEEEWTAIIEELKQTMANQLQKHMESYEEMMSSNVSLQELLYKHDHISAILADHK